MRIAAALNEVTVDTIKITLQVDWREASRNVMKNIYMDPRNSRGTEKVPDLCISLREALVLRNILLWTTGIDTEE